MNELETQIRAEIKTSGPMGLDRFMALALGHPRYGYYMTRDPLGLAGDFVTSPEISQMFGELLGIQFALTWQMMGEPENIALVELGPGRGTLMMDMLRSAKALSGFIDSIENIHLVETSPVLRKVQAETLNNSGFIPEWHSSIDNLPEKIPLLIIANEFFDALPVRQFQMRDGKWLERMVGIMPDDSLGLGLSPIATEDLSIEAENGAVFETSPIALNIMKTLSERIVKQRGMILAIDYGYNRFRFGESLQAVRRHAFTSILNDPGEADITAHVDFGALAIVAERAAAVAHPIITQATLLERLGINQRAEILKKNADDPRELDLAVERLAGTKDSAMGILFKALAVTSHDIKPPPGFDKTDLRCQ